MFKIKHLGAGKYSIRTMVKSDMGLAIISSSDMASAYIGESPWSPLDKGVWYIDSGVYGYTINSSYYYFYLGSPTNVSNGTKIELQSKEYGSNAPYQAWRLDRIDTDYNGVKIINSTDDMLPEDTYNFTAGVYSSIPNYNSQNVTWTSGNTSVATVNSSVRVTAVSPGTVTITARSTYDSGWSASKTVYVVPLEDGTYFFRNKEVGKYIRIICYRNQSGGEAADEGKRRIRITPQTKPTVDSFHGRLFCLNATNKENKSEDSSTYYGAAVITYTLDK